jgi:TPR repeat protein
MLSTSYWAVLPGLLLMSATAWSQPPTADPADAIAAAAHRPSSNLTLLAWDSDLLTTHEFDLVGEAGSTTKQNRKLHALFYSGGSVELDETAGPDAPPIHIIGRWKINGTDLEIYDSAGKLLNYWRLAEWSDTKNSAYIGLDARDGDDTNRVLCSFRFALRPPYASPEADTWAPKDDGGSLPLKEVTLTAPTPESMHFELVGGNYIALTIPVEGRPMRFLVDTGAFGSLLKPEAAAGLVDDNRKTELYVGGYGPKMTKTEKWTRPVELEFPGVSCRASLLVFPLDMPITMGHFDGMLGMDIMAQLRVRIDCLHQTITFWPPNEGEVPNQRGIVLLSKRFIYIPATLTADGAPPVSGSMQIDSGADGMFTLPMRDDLPLHRLRAMQIFGIGGKASAQKARLVSATLAGMIVAAPEVDIIKGHGPFADDKRILGAVGAGLLRRGVLTLDLPHRHVYFVPNAPPAPDVIPEVASPSPAPMSDDVKALLAKAQSGDPVAQGNLGRAYAKGTGVGRDAAQAAEWLKKAAAQNDPTGEAELARLLMYGDGVSKDDAQALALLHRAAAQNNGDAEAGLAYCYLVGDGVPRDIEQMKAWSQKAIDHGSSHAVANLAGYYLDSGPQHDAARAFALYQQAAQMGDPQGQYNLALMYQDGTGTPKDPAQAIALYQKAAGQGFPAAQHNLAIIYETGDGTKKDLAQAVAWYGKAADQNYEHSENNLGLLADTPEGHAWFVEALPRYEKLAATDGAFALQLANFYMYGVGVTQDCAMAVKWVRQGIALHSSEAEGQLGYYYIEGLGVAQDDARAAEWYQKSAAHGNSDGMVDLGQCYEYGQGVTKDINHARSLYQQAKDAGSDFARKS